MTNPYDVIISGGGLAGCACALVAAKAGKKTLLVERRPALGWESTWAGQLDFSGADGPIAQQIKAMLDGVGGLRGDIVDGPLLEIALDKMMADAGVTVQLYTYATRLVFEGDIAWGVALESKSGEQIVFGRAFVDATDEAAFWQQTVEPGKAGPLPAGWQSVFFNHADPDLTLPLALSDNLTLYPSVWAGEVRAEYKIDSADPMTARRQLPDAIAAVRAQVPQLTDALVSHLANEPFPASSMAPVMDTGISHPMLKNLFSAGIWVGAIENSPAGRLALGEEAGAMVAACDTQPDFSAMTAPGSMVESPQTEADVLVVGGGTGGAIAAIAAARAGAQTTLIEASPALGGIGAGGAIHVYYHGLPGGLQDEVDALTRELTPLFCGKWKARGFHPEAKKTALQQLADSAGVQILLNATVSGVLLQDGERQDIVADSVALALPQAEETRSAMRGVFAAAPDGFGVFGAKVFIDSTGDGDLAAMAGAPFVIGRDRDNLPHAFSQPAGVLDAEDGQLRFYNFDAGYVDPTDVIDMTRARRLGVTLLWPNQPMTEENRLLYIAPILGLRQSRQIVGEYQLTLADEVAGRRFEDAISFMQAHYDNHGFDYENESDEAAFWVWALNNWNKPLGCEIPYRAMLPKNVDGLLLACRAMSMTFDAHAAFRMQKDIQRIGEVAGLAAAQAVEADVSPAKINVGRLQVDLKSKGLLNERHRPKAAIAPDAAPNALPQLPDAADIDVGQVEEVAWLALQGGAQAETSLVTSLQSTDPEVRFRASAGLALNGSAAGAAELAQIVDSRDETTPEGRKQVARWQAAIPFLGMAGDASVVPALIAVLSDSDAPLDALIASARALGRLGDAGAIEPLRQMLNRPDLPTERLLQLSNVKTIDAVTDDSRWQLELATAESLAALGADAEIVTAIVKPHRTDDRAYVRRYANKVLKEAGLSAA